MASLTHRLLKPVVVPLIRDRAARSIPIPTVGSGDDILQRHVRRARNEGLAAGVLTTVAQATSIVGTAGTLTFPASIVGLGLDTAALRLIQTQMVTDIAVGTGRTPGDADAIYDDISSLRTDHGHGGTPAGGVAATGGRMVAERVRSLPGTVARAAAKRAVLMLGAGWVFRVLPVVNIPFTARSNARATLALGERALLHYH